MDKLYVIKIILPNGERLDEAPTIWATDEADALDAAKAELPSDYDISIAGTLYPEVEISEF